MEVDETFVTREELEKIQADIELFSRPLVADREEQ